MIQLSLTVSVLDKTPLDEAVKRKLRAKEIKNLVILKKSVDARKKEDVRYVYSVAVTTENDKKYLSKEVAPYEKETISLEAMAGKKNLSYRPVVVGTGPAGLFCALTLAYAGCRPIVIERGEKVEDREQTVKKFFSDLTLNPDSNVQFGEGGAGTFSDGKLNTNLHNEYIPVVLDEFIRCGAPEEIRYLAKPHVGTDNLRTVVKNMREKIIALGGEVRYRATVTDIRTVAGKITGVVTDRGATDTDAVFFAVGHSARDTFEMLNRHSVKMESKIYSMGVRIEHLRETIDRAQHGKFASALPAADYKMATSTPTGSSLYTFCMCPGGHVVNASSEEGGVCVNGMSYYKRDAVNSNSALLVNVGPEHWRSDHPLAGMEYQRKYERLTYAISRSYRPVVQTYGDFVKRRTTERFGSVKPSVESGYAFGDLRAVLPEHVTETLLAGIPLFGKKLRGFDAPDSVLTGIEARSSSPVRVLRGEDYQSSVAGLFPLGEGAGYAGGITSAAIDGIKGALAFLRQ